MFLSKLLLLIFCSTGNFFPISNIFFGFLKPNHAQCVAETGYQMASLYPWPQVRDSLPWVSGFTRQSHKITIKDLTQFFLDLAYFYMSSAIRCQLSYAFELGWVAQYLLFLILSTVAIWQFQWKTGVPRGKTTSELLRLTRQCLPCSYGSVQQTKIFGWKSYNPNSPQD